MPPRPHRIHLVMLHSALYDKPVPQCCPKHAKPHKHRHALFEAFDTPSLSGRTFQRPAQEALLQIRKPRTEACVPNVVLGKARMGIAHNLYVGLGNKWHSRHTPSASAPHSRLTCIERYARTASITTCKHCIHHYMQMLQPSLHASTASITACKHCIHHCMQALHPSPPHGSMAL